MLPTTLDEKLVLYHDLPFNREIIDSSCGLLVDPRDIGELAHAISSLVDDESKRTILSSKALDRSKAFDLSVRVKNLVDWLRPICL